MAYEALRSFSDRNLTLRFVSNVDGAHFHEQTQDLDPAETLFIVASKTFTTQETMANAHAARDWFDANGGTDRARHFVGVTTNLRAAAEFGITRTFGFWDWVGGRYSMWSAIGLPIAIAIGRSGFLSLLEGAHAMDRHFAEAPPGRNVPMLLGLLDVWYRNFHGFSSRSVAPYHQGLRRLPAYLQQLEMESNGKSVDMGGESLPYATSPVVWGEPGTNGQHAYFQMLHQGTDVVPVEFIVVKQPAHGLPGLHDKLLANALIGAWAQARPGHVPAPNAGEAVVLSLGGTRGDGRSWLFTEIIASAAGGAPWGPGGTGVSTDVGNTRNTPAEVIESQAPLRMERVAIRQGSGGAGRHRGGDGVLRAYRLLDGTGSISYRGERHSIAPQGAAGGQPGACATARIERVDGSVDVLPAKARAEWHAGDLLVIETAGAGGWGAA
jgi:hypothetical protein